MFRGFSQLFNKANKDLRKRIYITLFCLGLFALGSSVTIPWATQIYQDLGFLEIFNIMSGGGLRSFSIFALGVSPYITASIITQLLQMDIIPYFKDLKDQGYTGRQKINKINRYMGIIIGFFQAYVLCIAYMGSASVFVQLKTALVMTAGTAFCLWMGDQITNKGIGNGQSMLIMAGIILSMPSIFTGAYYGFVTSGTYETALGIFFFCLFILVYILIVVGIIWIQLAERRIPIQYTSSSISLSKPSEANYLPLKVNSASVIPVIFASSLMMAPIQIASFFPSNDFIKEMQKWLGLKTWYSLVIYVLLILFFTFFYTKMQINPEKVAENLGKSGSYIPSVRPGSETKDYINRVLSRITVLGSVALAFIAVMPHVMPLIWPDLPSSMALGGTGMIIVVGVAIETVRQVQGLITQKSYKKYYED